jgi:hypothetical protein
MRWPADFQSGERAGVGQDIARDRDREIVAAVFAFRADLRGDPPDGRVIEEHRLHHALQQVNQIVVAANVRELMRQQRLHVLRRQAAERSHRREDDRPQPSEHRGNVDMRGGHEAHRARHAHALHEALAGRLPLRGRGPHAGESQPRGGDPSAGEAQRQHRDAHEPYDHQPR